MAGEIRLQATTGLTIKALIVAEDGTVWNGSALVATNTLSDANWTASLVTCTEEQTSDTTGAGLYLANWPGALTQIAVYSVQFFTGASPSPGDLVRGVQQDPTEYGNVSAMWDEVLTGATHNIATSAGRRLRGIQAFGDYANGALWFDSVNGTGGQVAYENATVQNPSNSITDILALASSLNMVRIEVAPGSTLTLNATLAGFSVMGVNWTLVLNGKDVSGSLFSGANVSGTGTGANEIGFHHCHFANVTLPPSDLQWCVLEATFTIGSAGTFYFENCASGVAGSDTAGLDFGGALNSSNVNLRNYIGGIEIQNMGAGTGTYRMSFDCPAGQIIFNANCSDVAEIELRGNHRKTNNASGLTINEEARIDVGQINVQADAALADYNGPTNAEFVARTLLAAAYFDPSIDTVVTDSASRTASKATGFSTHDASNVVDEWETQSQAAPTGFHVNVKEVSGTAQTANDDGADINAIKVVTDALTSAAATKLALSAGTIVTGAAESGTLSTTQMTTDLGEATDDHFNGRIIIWTSGVLQNQATDISDYSGATGLLTYTTVTEAPSASDSFVII